MRKQFTPERCEKRKYPHNQRTRFTNGFYCEDCSTFFPEDSETYRRHEYVSTLGMVVHNIRAKFVRSHKLTPKDVSAMVNRLASKDAPSLKLKELDTLINEALGLIHRYGKTDKSADLALR